MIKVSYINNGELKEFTCATYEDAQELLIQNVFDGIDMVDVKIEYTEGE